MRAVVTGGGGFIGSHLCEALRRAGYEVVAVDSFLTGRRANLAGLAGDSGFELVEQDACEPLEIEGPVDAVMHFASPASPGKSAVSYMSLPFETLDVGSRGTWSALRLAHAKGARFLVASTSEVYGDPEISPQPESYWGRVNPIGPRSVYDEAKRFGEALSAAYRREHGLDVKIARIFNTYGPRLRPEDGRVISNLLVQAIEGRQLTVYGDGSQTRSFCYVDDLVAGILALLESEHTGPMNIGNPIEWTISELASLVGEFIPEAGEVVYEPLPEDDPKQRRPDISLAKEALGWEPKIDLREGLARTIAWYRAELAESSGRS